MSEQFVFGAIERNRERLLKQVENCPENKRTVVPNGFNNNVLWHLGHILTVTDAIVYGFTGMERKVPNTYQAFFGNGTKPADWTDDVPSWDSIISQLREQPQQLREAFSGKTNESVKENFFKAGTVEELLYSTLLHESGHSGNINSMLKVLNS